MTKKVKGIFYLISGIFLLFFGRLFYLQVVAGPRYHSLATFQSIRRIILKAPRGKIFDRKGRVLADVQPSFSLSILPREIDSLALHELEKIISIDKSLIEENRYSFSPVELVANIPKEKVCVIEERLSGLRGICLEVKPLRSYPYPFLFHPLGNLSKVTKDDLARDTIYARDDFIGKQGIEKEYEKILKGRDGMRMIEVDARGREIGPLPEVREIRPVSGCDLYLSLDLDLSLLVDSLFAPYKRGACVAIDPRDGRVILLYAKPYVDPNLFLLPLSKGTWERVKNNPQKPLFNRAIAASFPPGSTFKPLIVLAGMESGVLNQNRHLSPCLGGYKFGNRYFRCWSAHGSLNLIDAIAYSCNTYFYQAGLAIGLERIISTARQFPFGKKTGIDLPEEGRGILPTKEYLNRKYKAQIPKGIVLNLSIGQGEIAVTPLQLALFYCALANGGKIYQPHLVDSIKCPSGYHPSFLDSLSDTNSSRKYKFRPLPRESDTVYLYIPEAERIEIPPEIKRVLNSALHQVVTKGTGRQAFIPEIEVCGKTGTAENPFGQDHAWFVGYAPKEDPALVVCILIENVGKGSTHGVPIVQRILRRHFQLEKREKGAIEISKESGE